MKVFMDLEFTGLHKDASLISIGFVSENHDMFYAENADFDRGAFGSDDDLDFFKREVEPGLKHIKYKRPTVLENKAIDNDEFVFYTDVVGDANFIREELEKWFVKIHHKNSLDASEVQIVGDVCTYDWVLFCDLWGHALQVPNYIHYIPIDVGTLLPQYGYDSDYSRISFASVELKEDKELQHNALYDAHVIQCVYDSLIGKQPSVDYEFYIRQSVAFLNWRIRLLSW